MPWQRGVADVALEILPSGLFAYRIVIVHVQRQAGKTTLAGPVNLHRILTVPNGRAWLTAQRRQDARDILMDVIGRVRQSPLRAIADIRESNGSEAITFPTGGMFRVFAPTEDALHGRTNHLVGVDEAWAFNLDQGLSLEQAILPTFATTAGQLWLYSTAGTAASAWLWSYVERGRQAVEQGRNSGIAYFEYSLPDADVDAVAAGIEPTADPEARAGAIDRIMAAHPANGHTLRREAVEQAADSMPAAQFLRAYGNRWSSTSDSPIPPHLWLACRCHVPRPTPGAVALGFDVSLDRSDSCIAAAWRHEGRLYVDVIETGPGWSWVPGRLRTLAADWRAAVGYNRDGQALAVADELARDPRPIRLIPAAGADHATACGNLLAAITDKTLAHPGEASLDAATAVAAVKPSGDGFKWHRRGSAGSIAPLVAVTEAAWALDHAPAALPKPGFRTRES